MLAPLSSGIVSESPPPSPMLPATDIGFANPATIVVNPDTGAVHSENTDGSVTISFGGKGGEQKETDFDDNLAEIIDESTLNMMGEEILRGVEEDIRSRQDWEDTFNRGLDLLGLKLEEASGDVASGGNISRVHHPLLLEAAVRYQATASAELLPASGPVKARDDDPLATPNDVTIAEAFEKDFNHYLTVVRKEYYPDYRRMLFGQGFCGNGFKKVYKCPIRKAPVSDYVAAKDLIVSNDIISLLNASRVTQRLTMRHSVMKRLQLNGHFREVSLVQPTSAPTQTDMKIGSIEGLDRQMGIAADHPYTIYECYTEYDIPGFEHKNDDDKETGLPLPYRITIDKDSRKILEVRRNWKESDPDFMARQRFVKYGYVPGFGFYDYGLVHLLGQTTRALTAIERQLIDAGQFSNFPGVLISDVGGRQETTQIRVPPGGAQVIKTAGLPIGQVVMALPYKEPSAVLVNIAAAIEENGRRLGSTAEVNVGEGRADVPVGTTIALIEQSTKLMASVHKQNHEAQQQEFLLLKELFEEDPACLWKFAKTPARKWEQMEEFSDITLVPASDPNVPSHIHRVMQATGLAQMAQASGNTLNKRAVESILLTTLGYSPSALQLPLDKIPPNMGDPSKMAKIQLDAMKQKDKQAATAATLQSKQQESQISFANDQAERESREKIQHLKTVGNVLQVHMQTQAEMSKHTNQHIYDTVGDSMERSHGLAKQAKDHAHDREQQGFQRAHEKEIAKQQKDVVSSNE